MASLYRSLTVSFGAVVLALMGLFLVVASVLSFRIQETRQENLAQAFASVVTGSLNRVDTAQMPTLVRELSATVPGLGFVAVADLDYRLVAHSDPTLVGQTLGQAGLSAGSRSSLVWKGTDYLQISRPLKGASHQGPSGWVLVGVSWAALRQDQARFLGALTLLSLGGTLLAMGVVFFLGRRFGGQTQNLAVQLQGFLDRSPVGLAVVDARGTVVQRSRSFASFLADPGAPFPEALASRLGPDQALRLRAETEQVRVAGQDSEGLWTVGDATWQITQFPLTSHQTGLIVQDLTRRVRAEQDLVDSRTQLNQIIDLSPVGMAVVDLKSQKILRLNRRFTETYGYTLEDCPDLPSWFGAAFPDETARNRVVTELRWALDAGGQRSFPVFEVALRARDGTEKWVKAATALVGTLAVVTLVDQTNEKRAEDALFHLNRSLEEKVRQRTEELELTYRELTDAEKLAALGQLAAGMAHELNTPLGAIQAANRINQEFYVRSLKATVTAVRSLDDDALDALFGLLDRNLDLAKTFPGSPHRPRRRALVRALEDAGLDASEETAEYLLELGWDEASLGAYRARPGEWRAVLVARDLLSLLRMNAIVADGTEKASHVVNALRRYLRGKDDAEVIRFPVADQLEILLTLFQHRTKHAVQVVRDFEPGVTVVGDRQQLNQVWINLIQNALQAMGFLGTLTLSVRTVGRTVEVAVSDTGAGIDEAIRDKIFTPYFTTKNKGDGLGLGLDLCRKIVEAHQGTLTFVSQPGHTTFTVTLPA